MEWKQIRGRSPEWPRGVVTREDWMDSRQQDTGFWNQLQKSVDVLTRTPAQTRFSRTWPEVRGSTFIWQLSESMIHKRSTSTWSWSPVRKLLKEGMGVAYTKGHSDCLSLSGKFFSIHHPQLSGWDYVSLRFCFTKAWAPQLLRRLEIGRQGRNKSVIPYYQYSPIPCQELLKARE